MDLKVFQQFNNIIAGFTKKPDNAESRRMKMAAEAAENHRYVIHATHVHGKTVADITNEILCEKSYIVIEDTDGLITNVPGVRLTSVHGDCIPVYAYDPVKKVIGLSHAGWRGTALGISFEMIEKMKSQYGCNPENIFAFIGPGIGKCHFEFGKDMAEKFFFSQNSWTQNYSIQTEDPDKLLMDLKGINEHFLSLSGVKNIEISNECTYCDIDNYYSYRRGKDMERMLAYIEILR